MALPRARALTAVALATAALLLGGCASAPSQAGPRPRVSPLESVNRRWPEIIDDMDPASFVEAADRAAEWLEGVAADRRFQFGVEERTADELAAGLRRAAAIVASAGDPSGLAEVLRAEFVLLRSIGRDGLGEVLITGYYEPVLEARRWPDPPFVHPVYGVPEDLVTLASVAFGVDAGREPIVGRVVDGSLVPYPDRADIDRGEGLPEDTDVLGWVADRVDLFFLHVQGSGTLVFEDGARLRAGFAASNGREYRSIGRLLIDEGAVPAEKMSMQAIRGYLEAHPEELDRVLSFNPRYVFFRRLPADGGPLGCFGTPLMAGRSIATDRRLLPAPVPAILEGSLPAAAGGSRRLARLVVNQDTGSSIVGPGRVDLYFGAGADAGELAGRTKHLGRLFILLPRTEAVGR